MNSIRKIELNLGHPKNGWLPVELKSLDFELNFRTSNIPETPTDKLCESLILALNGIATEICWDLEPKCYFFRLKPNGNKIHFIILRSDGVTKKHNFIFEFKGDFNTVILPMYRSLKKFNTIEINKTDWEKINLVKLNKLTKLVNHIKMKK
ncbi:hypothetical protein [Aquimarina algiphila]|uniref:hypothetical protein n=1 Tax=Aquimarina algiphila TaxID=2047982 RepID=UPI00232DB5FA|nr:hypothetical protein [Aquimarina algiphila]